MKPIGVPFKVVIKPHSSAIPESIGVPTELSEDEFFHLFIGFIESDNWAFGGGITEFVDQNHID